MVFWFVYLGLDRKIVFIFINKIVIKWFYFICTWLFIGMTLQLWCVYRFN